MSDEAGLAEDDIDLVARAAWLHHVGRLTQSEVATRPNVPNVKAHRLIARAGREGMVRVFVDGEIACCIQLEQQLCRVCGLAFYEVAPSVLGELLPLRSLGMLGARYLAGLGAAARGRGDRSLRRPMGEIERRPVNAGEPAENQLSRNIAAVRNGRQRPASGRLLATDGPGRHRSSSTPASGKEPAP